MYIPNRASYLGLTLLCIVTACIFSGVLSYPARFRNLPQKQAAAQLENIITNKGASYAWSFLKETYLSDGMLLYGKADVHTLAHQVGTSLYNQYGPKGISICDSSFTSGCYHGYVEAYLVHAGSAAASEVASLCGSMQNSLTCAHGAGHGFGEAFTLTDAVSDCQKMSDTLAAQCVEGAIMEHGSSWEVSQMKKTPWSVCMQIPNKYGEQCAAAVGNYIGESFNPPNSVAYIASVCRSAPATDMRDSCFDRLGQTVARRTYGHSDSIHAQCGVLFGDEYHSCLIAAYGLYSVKYADPKKTNKELCDTFFMESDSIACPQRSDVTE